MKKDVLKLITVAGLILGLSSCADDFLVEEPTQFINADQLGEIIDVNPLIGDATMTGIYETMFRAGTGGTTSHDDFGQKGYDVYMDMLCGDMALATSTYGWYRANITEFQAPLDFTRQENYRYWRYYYRVINLSNLLISSLQPQIESGDFAAATGYTYGQALAMRAHSYFYLTQLAAKEYNPSAEILPIYTESGIAGKPKSTMGEVYELMENDLTTAIALLDGYNRPTKTQINKPIAQTILAYVLASRRDRWTEVATLTAEAMAGSGATLMDNTNTVNGIRGGFNNIDGQGLMWGIDLNEDIGLGLISWWGQIDYFSYSYAAVGDAKSMDVDLYNSMRPDDVRRQQFFPNPGPNFLQPIFKFYDSDRVAFGSSQIVKADYHYMRYAELILLNAEALANLGQDGPARTMLGNLVNVRVADPSYLNGLTGQALKDEIYKQIRLELWGEGKSYLAMKRGQRTITRGANHLSFVGVPIPHNDDRLTFKIPQQELQDNVFINDQND